ncbi:MAG: 16S rRNA (cytosine(1402)-N(4))-methyltransferase RsmH [Candidatus Kryptoniota bacterium]
MVPEFFHEPVLLKESVDLLVTDLNGSYVDATFGGGGHTREILRRLSANGKVIALDVDSQAERVAGELEQIDMRLKFFRRNFSNLNDVVKESGIESFNGILFDLGVSSYQIDLEAGMSYRRDEPLDMRLDKTASQSAYDIVNTYDFDKLVWIFWNYGEEPKSRQLARAILKYRQKGQIKTTGELSKIIEKVCGKSIKSLSRVFQAIRIAVNNELENLSNGLNNAVELLNVKGRIVVISYHSLEDRIVKEKFKYEASTCVCPPEAVICTCGKVPRLKILTRKPIVPGRDEVAGNRRARSAKLRAAEKVV